MSKKLAFLIACIACAIALIPSLAFADSLAIGDTFTVDNITYGVTDADTVSLGPGKVGTRAIDKDYSGKLDIPETVTYQGTTYRVTSIGAYACAARTSLTEVSIPASVISIGFNAFAYCGTMDDSGDTPVYGGLRSVSFAPNAQIATIGENAFIKDYALQAFTIPASVTSISQRAFQDCFSFERVECEEGSHLRGIAAHAFGATLPEMDPSTTPSRGAGPGAWPTNSLQTQDDDTSNTAVKTYARLQSVSLPSTMKSLGDGAFENQRALTSLSWADDCEMASIGTGAFQYCTALEDASVPTLTHELNGLGPYSFQYCVNLKTFTYKGVVTAPYSGYSERGLFRGVTSLESVIYLADKHHTPFGTLVGDYYEVTGDKTFTECNPDVFYLVTFYGSEEDATNGANPIGSAVIREHTTWTDITNGLPESDEQGVLIFSGSIPALDAGYGWSSPDGGGSVELTNASVAYPVVSNDLAGGGISLSQTAFTYSNAQNIPDVVVIAPNGTVLESNQYTLIWERKNADGTWSATTDFTSSGTLRVSATAVPDQGYEGTTQPTEFTITPLEAEDTFVASGITYSVLTASDSGNPTVMVGDDSSLAIDSSTTGALTIPATVRPDEGGVEYKVVRIGSFAFGGRTTSEACGKITSVTIPEGITSIGPSAFRNMDSLESVKLPASLTSIEANAFANNISLTTVDFGASSIESIGMRAFANCQSLKSFEVPAVTTLMNAFVFENCLSLNTVTFLGDIAHTVSNQLQGCSYLSAVVFCADDPGIDISNSVQRYARVSFEDETHTSLGAADILVGTVLQDIGQSLPKSAVLAGEIPALPAGKAEWSFSVPGPTLTKAATATASGTAPIVDPDDPSNPGTDNPSDPKIDDKISGSYTAGAKQTKAVYKVTSATKHTVTYKKCKSMAKNVAKIPAKVTIKGQTFTVTKVAAKAFKSSKTIKTVKVASKKITSFKNAFKASSVTKVKVPKAKKAAYKKLLTKKVCGRNVTVV